MVMTAIKMRTMLLPLAGLHRHSVMDSVSTNDTVANSVWSPHLCFTPFPVLLQVVARRRRPPLLLLLRPGPPLLRPPLLLLTRKFLVHLRGCLMLTLTPP